MGKTNEREVGDPFYGSFRRLDRAKHHTADLDRQWSAFKDSNPYSYLAERDPEAIDYIVYKIKLSIPFPQVLEDIAIDAVFNLRAALDMAVYAVAVKHKLDPNAFYYFPFSKGGATNFENNLHGRLKDFPQEILAIFRSLKPYKGENDFLCSLNHICNRNKHGLLTPVGCSIAWHQLVNLQASGDATMFKNPQWDSLKDEVVFGRARSDAKVNYDVYTRFFVSFSDVDILIRKPAVDVLHALADEVEGILMAIEMEGRRIGLFK